MFAVNHSNVIFAVTRHGGHLGYFEGGIVLPNAVTWLDRIVVQYSNALLRCKPSTNSPLEQICDPNSVYANHEPPAMKLLPPVDDDDDNEISDGIQASPTLVSCEDGPLKKVASEMVAEILHVSASKVFDGNGTALPRGSGWASRSGIRVKKSAKIKHSAM